MWSGLAFFIHVAINWHEVMKVHLVFSLNVTGSFADDGIHVFSSVRYRLFGKLLADKVLEIIRHRFNMNEKVLSHFIAEKIIFRIII